VLHTRQLIDIGKLPTSGERNKAYIELATELGASGLGRDMQPGEKEAAYKAGINQALQTLAMIDMCETAARGYEMATKASKSASKQFRIMAAIAFLSMLAAWLAAFYN
jgi:hypothetical protein